MVPPPNSTGDEFPDFDSMSPEEQMAWLESLARRQGAKPEEFVTAADLEIAEVSPDVVIDEPGYVPYSISEKEKPASTPKAAEPAPVPVPTEPVPTEPVPMEMGADELPDLISELESGPSFEPEPEIAAAGTDPMRWLDSLSAQSETELPEPMAVAEDDTAEFLAAVGEFEDIFAEAMPQHTEAVAQEVEAVAQEPEEYVPQAETMFEEAEPELEADLVMEAGGTDAEDPLGGMDPMLWLESLAKRQGANVAELTTSADLEIEEPPADVVIDEPGYVPYDVVAGGPRKVEEAPVSEPVAEIAVEPEPQLEEEMAPSFETSYEEPSILEEAEAMLDGVDPMEWLESLAKRQGAKVEELTTSAALEIPEVPKETVIDEPGYVAFSAFGDSFLTEAADEAEAALASETDLFAGEPDLGLSFEPEAAQVADVVGEPVDESLAWLADLAAEPDTGALDLFGAAARESEALGQVKAEVDDILAGMTDDEIAYAQAHGQLTPQQELEWLKRQAAKLASVRQEAEEVMDEMADLEPAEVPPAAPGQLPPWLEDMRAASEAEGEALFAESAVGEASAIPAEDWLDGMVAQQEAGVAAVPFDSDVNSLWAEISDEEAAATLDTGVIAETADLFAPDSALGVEYDQLAEALDSEYERKLAGDDSEPEWYTQALRQEVDSLLDAAIAERAALASDDDIMLPTQIIETADLSEAVPINVPDWLAEAPEKRAPVGIDDEIPSWLTESADVIAPSDSFDMPVWLTEAVDVPADDLGWLNMPPEPVSEPPVSERPAPAPVAQVPQPRPVTSSVSPEVSAPVARPLPQGELFGQYRQRLEQNPNDHATRLALARALRTSHELEASLDQYEALIEVAQLLPDIGTDLSDLVKEHEHEPRIRRLLGDTYMRKGMLREALEAYRSALDQL